MAINFIINFATVTVECSYISVIGRHLLQVSYIIIFHIELFIDTIKEAEDVDTTKFK